MACQLYSENDISALYTIVRGEIMDRIQDPKLGKFDQKALNKFIKEIHKEFEEDPNGILYAQAIPDMLMLVANDVEIKKYLRSKDVNLDFNYVQDLSLEFEDIEYVKKWVMPKRATKTKKEVDSEIKEANKNSKNITQNNNNSQTWAALDERAKVDYPDKTSGNIAVAKNPEKMTEAERNQIDPQKGLFDRVIKTVIWASRNRGNTDAVMLGDTAIMLKAQPIRSLEPADLTEDDIAFLTKNKGYDINVAIVSDAKGNPIRFDENGNVVETGGRIVYQYIRPVINRGGRLYLGNRSGFLYNLVTAKELAKKEIAQEAKDGKFYNETERQAKEAGILAKQTQKMNDLAKLNEVLATSKDFVLLPITGGSYGIVEHKSELLSNTDFVNDLEMIFVHDSGTLEGDSYFMTNRVSAGVAVDNRIYLQRMDMPKDVASTLAKVLTTKALLNGEPLSPQARLTYYETYLTNQNKGNNIKVEIKQELGQNVLKVTLKDPMTGEASLIDLDSADAEKQIFDHLLEAKKLKDKNGNVVATYPASMSYMKSFAVDGAIQKGETFTDYEFTVSKTGTQVIREVQKDYFDFIKPLAKVDYTTSSAAYFVGINSYVSFTIPFDLETPADELVDIGIPTEDSLTSDDIDNGDKPVKVLEETDKEAEKGFTIETKQSTLANDRTLTANINEANAVFGLGTDFTTKDEKHVQQTAAKNNKWYGVKLGSKQDAPKGFKPSADAVNQMVKNLSAMPGGVVNVIGNDMAQLAKEGYTQADIDKYVYNILSEVAKQYPISKIISNGQTGVAEASIKAAKKLGIPVKIRAFQGYQLRVAAPYLATGVKSTKNSRADFLGRFFSKSSKTYKKANAKVSPIQEDATETVPKTIEVTGRTVEINGKTVEQQKVVDRKIARTSLDDALEGFDVLPDFERSKRAAALMNKLYGSEKSWQEVEKWWDTTPLKFLAKVERQKLALVFNSTAYGTFLSAGSLLSEAANKLRQEGFAAKIELYGDAQPITLYHEAWHAFSQLVLTLDEKTKLYDEIRTYDKWADKEYIDIEEDLAENFIDFAVNGKKQTGFIQRIFDKIKKLLDYFFGNTTSRDLTRLYDIPSVKEYYNKLYTGKFTIDTQNAENNLMPGFQRLNSAKKLIQPVDQEKLPAVIGEAKQLDFDSDQLKDDDLAIMLFNQALGTNVTSISELTWDDIKDNIFYQEEDGDLGIKNLAYISGSSLYDKPSLKEFLNQSGGYLPKTKVFIGESVIYPNVFEVMGNMEDAVKRAVYDNLFDFSGAFQQIQDELDISKAETFVIQTPSGKFYFPKRFASGFYNIAAKTEALIEENRGPYVRDWLRSKREKDDQVNQTTGVKAEIVKTYTVNDPLIQNAISTIGNSIIENAIADNSTLKIHIFSNDEFSKDGFAGWYQPKNNIIYIHESALTPQSLLASGLPLIAHELVHSVTAQALNYNNFFQKEVQDLLDAVRQKTGTEQVVDLYGFKNTHEFLAEAFSNQEFRELLKNTTFSKEQKLSIWQMFINAILRLFGREGKYTRTTVTRSAQEKLSTLIDQRSFLISYVPAGSYYENMYTNRTIQNLKGKDFAEITDVQSSKIVDLMDALMAKAFTSYNTRFNTTSGAVRLLSDVTNRQKLYSHLEKQLNALLENQRQKLEVMYKDQAEGKEIDPLTELKENQKFELLFKASENYGIVDEALSKRTNKGVVAFHMQRSRFSILKDQYIDNTEDATTALFKTEEGNSISAKQLATDDTMMMLSGIYELETDSDGNYITEENEAGIKTYSIKTDDFGLPSLEPVDRMWSKVARTLQGSLDYQEMHDRLSESIDNYPEFIQILEMLPNPYIMGPGAYNNKTEFQSETNFWQDLKKPVIPFIQLNINKTVLEKAKKVEGKWIPEKAKYESRLAAANFDIYRIIADWTTNFNIADPATNKFVVKDGVDNYLDTAALMKEFTQDKQLIPYKAVEFLAALGIQLDMTSAEIKAIVNNKKKPFSSSYNIDFIYNNVRMVHLAGKSDDIGLQAAAAEFKRNPLYYLLNGLPDAISKAAGDRATDVKTKVRALAELQNRFSDGYSNYSVLTPEKNRVWEQFLDNTITRIITSLNRAQNWQQLTMDEADPNGRFQHMRWLAEQNNPASEFSVVINSIFDLNPMSDTYGQKFPGASILLENIGGTQIINRETNDSLGTSTANTDVTSKFLQELHTMLQSGVQEFMRHASKQTAMNLRARKVKTYSSKESSNLYVDIMAFSPANTAGNNNLGESQGFNIMLGYIAAEAGRIFRFKSNPAYFGNFSSYNREVVRKDNDEVVKAGEAFTAFDDVLYPEMQGELYAIIDKAVEDGLSFEEFNLRDIVNDNTSLRASIKENVIEYFNKQSQANYARLEDARFVDQSLYDMVATDEFSKDQIDKMLVKAYTYNSWIHNFETTILAYGDAVQYNHDKEEFHKRNAGLGSGGRGFRADFRARMYINSPMFERLYAQKQGYQLNAYNGTLTSAIIKELVVDKSVYKDEYFEEHVKDYTARYIKAGKSKAEAESLAKELADIVLGDYSGMKIADGQGWINFEAYRMLKNLEGSWSAAQDDLYRKIVNGDTITAAEIKEYFPSYKVQYYGPIKTKGLPLTSFHKFSLAPLIPTVHTANTKLGQIHDMMLKQNVDYVLMETGEKVGHLGFGDAILDKDGNVDTSVTFTKNVIFAEYLKNQTEVNSKYKAKSIFSTQLRKLILEGLYEQGEITSDDPYVRGLVTNYVDRVGEYTELLKNELVDQLGFRETEDGEFVPVDKDSVAKLAKMIRENLTRDDVYSDKLIDIIDVTEEGELRFDLSLHPEAVKIEKLLLSLINKRIIKQKVKGEPLVQKSSGFYDGLVELPIDLENMNPEARDAAVKKYMGSNFLPTYHKGVDGKTTAMKVAIALQGDYESLLNLDYQGEPISTLDRLNQAIKDDAWLDENDGSNRKAITMVGVRIPVQGLNSMEFMEVYHFLPPQAGNIIIPPAEIVAKSGADFDIDKLSIFMNNIDPDGNVRMPMFDNTEDFYEAVKDPSKYDMTKDQMYALQKAGLENQLINDIRSILELPQNYVSLTTPNGTYLVKPIADMLSEYVSDYNPLQSLMSDKRKLSAPDKKGKQKEVISPTRIFEAGYNLYKHESNVVGKKTLGLGAIENTFNVVFNSLGAVMPAVYKHSDEEINRVSFLGLRHNKTMKDGQEVISISNQYDVDGNNKVADVINQLMNGWVDVEKDAWVFFVQGNYEVAPILLYLLKAGVSFKEAVYFVSQPLVRDYVKQKRLAASTFAEPLRKDPGFQGANFKAASNVIAKYFKDYIPDDQSRYQVGQEMYDKYLSSRKRDHFTEQEMLALIKKAKTNPEVGASDLSKTMFLHYLTIEKQIQGITELKMAANPDTALNTDVGQAIQAEANIEALAEQTKIDQDLRISLLNDSIISSFFNNKLVKGLAKPLFKFRYDEDIQDYIQQYMSNFQNTAVLKAAFGRNYRERFPVVFRNDILSYIFQNALRKYTLGNEYSSYALSESISLAPAAGLKFGAQVTEVGGKPTMIVDRVQIEKEFFDKAYLQGSEAQNNYESRGLYALQPGHFGNNSASNKAEYIRFVIEREYLRHLMPMAEISKTKEFQMEFENAEKTRVEGDQAKNRRYAYEKIIATRALDNVLNPYNLFNDRDNAYAVRLDRIKTMYKNDFVKDYPVLARMVTESTRDKSMYNIYVDDKDMNTFKSNMYSKNLEDLANRNVMKVEDKGENDRISDFFAKMTYVAMMQAGTNKSKYNFLSLTDFDKFIDIMNDETAKFLNAPTKLKLLVDFKNKFEQVNSQVNKNKARFKNYLTALDVEKAEAATAIEEAEELISSESLVERKNLIPTFNPNVFVYNDLSGTEKAYKFIVDNNQDITFIYQLSLGQMQAMEKMTEAQFNSKKMKGNIQLRKFANSSSVGIITGQNSVADSFSKTDPKYFKALETEIEKSIAAINDVIEKNGKVAFSINGYGDPALMPKELFVYLSRRLFEEFQYLNPGSEFAKEVVQEVAKYQPVTDAEILAKFEGENNPLKC